MPIGDLFGNRPPAKTVAQLPIPDESLVPVAPAVQQPNVVTPEKPGSLFANADPAGLQLASILGTLAQGYGQQTGQGGQLGGAISSIAQQGLAAKNVGGLAGETKLTAPDQEGPTTETMKRNADGTYTRTITGLNKGVSDAVSSAPGTAFGTPVQRPFNQPTQPSPGFSFEGLGGLPVATQLALLGEQRAGQAAQRAARAQAFEQAQDPVTTVTKDAAGNQYTVHRSGAIKPLGVAGAPTPPVQQRVVTVPSGPGGEQTTYVVDAAGQPVSTLATGLPQPRAAGATGALTENQRIQVGLDLQKEVRSASRAGTVKGKILPKEVSSRDIATWNATAERAGLPYKYTKIKVNYDPLGRGDYRQGMVFQTDASGQYTATSIYQQLTDDYGLSDKDARAYVRKMIEEQQ